MNRAILIPMILLLGATSAAAQDERGARRPGFTLALGLGGNYLELLEDGDRLFATGPVDVEPLGSGGQIELGYAFGPDFALQLRLVGSEHATGDPTKELGFGLLELDAVATLSSRGYVRPYVAGGIGAAVIGLEQRNGPDDALMGGAIDFGGGLDVHLGRRWALAFDYRFGLQNFEREVLTDEAQTERDVDLSSHSHRFGMRTVFSF